ncbi:alcohol dehydrogenase catalytic domain-containing protein [Saccharopolyspora soli]|uniref:alcohol dehydrogenase catalytic domain-containing protein n=1 Tax=Saccharopolyspora soli TaxID=2926618 RepID=UPI0035586E22
MYAITLDSPAPLIENPLWWREITTPTPGPGQLLIKVAGCGVCRSNLHMVEGDWVPGGVPAISPIIPGREVTGTVAAVGAGVAGFVEGDRVGVQPLWWTCEECEFCTSGREQLCHRRQITGEHVNGGYAEYLVSDACGRGPAWRTRSASRSACSSTLDCRADAMSDKAVRFRSLRDVVRMIVAGRYAGTLVRVIGSTSRCRSSFGFGAVSGWSRPFRSRCRAATVSPHRRPAMIVFRISVLSR